MILANPQYLWGLLGLLVPIAIHLWSNKKGKVIKIGSLKYLRETDAAQTNSIHLNELLLLFLRLLIIGLVVLLMTSPSLPMTKREKKDVLYLVETSLLRNQDLRNRIKAESEGKAVRYLEKGFAEVDFDAFEDADQSVTTAPKYWQLLQEINSLRADSVVIFTHALLKGIKGKRPKTSKKINWILLELPEEDEFHTIVNKAKTKSFEISLDENNLTVAKSETENYSGDGQLQPPYKIVINEGDSIYEQSRYYESAIRTISKYLDYPMEIKKNLDTEAIDEFNPDLLIDINNSKPTQTAYKTIYYDTLGQSASLIKEIKKDKVFVVTKPLNAEVILEHNVLEKFIDIMDLYPGIREQIDSLDNRKVSAYELESDFKEMDSQQPKEQGEPINAWLGLCLGLVLVTERFISKNRRQ